MLFSYLITCIILSLSAISKGINIPILQRRKLRFKQIRQLASCQAMRKWQHRVFWPLSFLYPRDTSHSHWWAETFLAPSSLRQCALCLQQPLESVVLFAQPLGRPPRGGGGCHPPPGLLKIDGPSLLHPLTHLTPPQAWLSDHVWTPLLSAGLHQKH